jgi:NADH dehydrogenase FAD-containing subunit
VIGLAFLLIVCSPASQSAAPGATLRSSWFDPNATLHYSSTSRTHRHATVLMAEVRAVDTSKRLVQIDSVSIPYDYLVLATGRDWAEVAPGLKP